MATLSAGAKAKLQAWLGAGSGTQPVDFVLEVSPVRLSDSATVTLYSSAYGYRGAPGESPARFEMPSGISISVMNPDFGRVREDGDVDLSQFKGASFSTGNFRILNADGQFDDWRKLYSFGDAAARIMIGYKSEVYANFESLWPFLIEKQPAASRGYLDFSTKPAVFNVNQPVQADLYTTPDELKGTPKPVWLGECYSVSPPRTGGSATPTYQLTDVDGGAMNSIDKGYEGGHPDTTAHTGYTENLAAGTCQLGNEPQGDVTFDGKGEKFKAGVYSDLQSEIANEVLDRNGLTNFPSADVTAFNTATGSPNSGIYYQGGRIGEQLSWILGPRAVYFPDQDASTPRMVVVKNPAGETASETYAGLSSGKSDDGADIKDIRIRSASPPAYHVSLGYQELYHQPGTLFTEDPAEVARQSSPRMYATATDASVQTDYPNAVRLFASSPLTDPTEAATEASNLLTLFKVPRVVLEVDLVQKLFHSWVGDYVSVKFDRLGLDSGQNVFVAGYRLNLNPNSKRFTMICWTKEPGV